MGVAGIVLVVDVIVAVGRSRLQRLLLLLADFEEDDREGTLALQPMDGKERL